MAMAGALAALMPQPAAARRGRDVPIAVAANFTEPARAIAAAFEKGTGHRLLLSFGSTGQLYAQITQGAPFEVLLAADAATPAKAIDAGVAVAGTAFTYAVGRLALYSRSLDLTAGDGVLKAGKVARIAIANPATAPYGVAAVEVLKALGVHDLLQARIVQGNTIAQTFQFVDTGNAEVGLVALSQVLHAKDSWRWVVPVRLHAPIAQDAVLLKAGADSHAAKALLAFLKGEVARAVIERYGYGVGV